MEGGANDCSRQEEVEELQKPYVPGKRIYVHKTKVKESLYMKLCMLVTL